MNGLKDYKIAAAITAVVVLLSMFLGVFRSVSKEARKVEKMFYEGVDGSGYGIEGDLQDRLDCAEIILKLAHKYQTSKWACDEVDDAIMDFREEPDASPRRKCSLDRSLQSALLSLTLELEDAMPSEQDMMYLQEYLAMFESCGLTIDREAAKYNAEVRRYQENVCSTLPVRLVSWLIPMPELEAYQ